MRWVKRGVKRGSGTVRGADGFDSAAFSATSASTKPPKRSDRLLCNRQAGQFSGSTWPSWQSSWPKGRPQLTAAKSTVSTSSASAEGEPIEMSVLRVSMIFDFSGLAKKRNFNLLSVGYPIELDISTRDRCLPPVPRHFYLCRSNRFTLPRRDRRVPHQVRPH